MSRLPIARMSCATAMALAALSGTAHAAQLDEASIGFVYHASAGEPNDVTVSARPLRATKQIEVTIVDTGATSVTPWPGMSEPLTFCKQQGTSSVKLVCTFSNSDFFTWSFELGDQNDTLVLDKSTSALNALEPTPTVGSTTASFGTVDGAEGSDTLTDLGNEGVAPTLHGGSGADTLVSAEGDTLLLGEDGADTLVGGEGADWLDGGLGLDSLTYVDGRPAGGVVVNMLEQSTPSNGAKTSGNVSDFSQWDTRTSGDVVAGIENVTGTASADVMVGNSANNRLIGNGGRDQLIGNAGIDALIVTGGPSKLIGGAGNDMLYARNATADTRIDCGADNDNVYLDAVDVPWSSCEKVLR